MIWGISANSHDAAISVHNNDQIEFASHTERFSGNKNDAHLNQDIINYAVPIFYPLLVKQQKIRDYFHNMV